MKTITVSPIELAIGDRVLAHGAIVEVVRINTYACDVPEGIRVAACTSLLIGDDFGYIPPSWFDTRESLIRSGCTWANELPEGRYWNVQGNNLARVLKVVA